MPPGPLLPDASFMPAGLAAYRNPFYRPDISIRYIGTKFCRAAAGGSDMSSGQLYDTIGTTYTVTRRTEPRIAAQVWAALGDARTDLDAHVRRGVSVWARVGPDAERRAVQSLRADLADGRWADRNRDLADLEAAELGLRLLTA
jgi:hypothetical protein